MKMENKSILNKAWYYSIFLVAIFPVLGIKLTSISINIVGLISFFLIIKEGKSFINKKKTQWLLLFSSLYIVYLLTSIFHPFNHEAIFVLEKKLSLLVFPIIFFLIPINIIEKHLNQVLLIFALSTLSIAIFTNFYILITGIPPNYLSFHDISYSYRNYFEDISKIHPTYISIYLAFSAFIFLNLFLKKETKGIYLLGFTSSIICIMLLSAKMPIIAFLLSLGLYLLMKPKNFIKLKFIVVAIIATLAIAIFTIPSLKIRLNELINSSLVPPKGENYNSINVRAGINNCSFALIKTNYMFGVGAGQLQNQLDICYKDYNTTAYSEIRYNTHNEYFNILLSTGIAGLAAFLILLITLFYEIYRIKNLPFFTLITLVTLCFLTENLMDRQGGVVFFAFFTSLFIRVYILQSKKESKVKHIR